MFDRIKKALGREPRPDAPPSSLMAAGPVSEWAATQGFGFSVDNTGRNMALEGKVGGRAWRMQLGKPSRNYIFGEEVRGRADLGIDEGVSVLVINRPLKEALEKRAYEVYTDSLQTSVDASLPEEMRWLAMFEEVGWEKLPDAFWARYAVLTDNRACAMSWITQPVAHALCHWPQPAPSPEVPFVMLLMNGKAYMRMEYAPAELSTLQSASAIFTSACQSALDSLKKK